MEKSKKPFYKQWWFWVFVFLFFLVMDNLNTGKKIPASDPAPEGQEEVKTDPAASISETLGLKDADIAFKDDYVEIVYSLNSTPYDYTDYVSKGLTDFVQAGKLVFATDYKTLRMDMQVDGSAATSLIMSKDNFESIDWSSLAYTEGIYDQIQDKFQKFYVESTLMKDVDTTKIMYKGK